MVKQRQSGILLHLTSLPGPFGIGDLGGGLKFIDFLVESGQSCWQFLPTCPTAEIFSHSPYMGLSALAGNTLLISPDLLVEDGWLQGADIEAPNDIFSDFHVDFKGVIPFKEQLLALAFERLNIMHQERFATFCEEQKWLDDYALFMVAKNHYQGGWPDWPRALASRQPKALADLAEKFSHELALVKFGQFIFFDQWHTLHSYAQHKGVVLCGDIPIYVGHDSVDVWANQDCFQLGADFQPTLVAGVPPDYFSATGQRWGNPLYRWTVKGEKNEALYEWWRQRFTVISSMVDMVRIDHFRGFEAYWQIPAEEETAMNGTWVKGPGYEFFVSMGTAISEIEIIAEDLGVITPEVEKLRDDLGFPGMKILQFAFDSDEQNYYLPCNYSENFVVYSGTHDNDTAVGWYLDPKVAQRSKDRLRRYANSDGSMIHHDFLRLAYGSVARLAIIPIQDVLGYGSDCRMNTPATVEDNWIWRCSDVFTADLATFLGKEALFYNRQAVFPEDSLDKDPATE